jgi:hypothetical protein
MNLMINLSKEFSEELPSEFIQGGRYILHLEAYLVNSFAEFDCEVGGGIPCGVFCRVLCQVAQQLHEEWAAE